MKPKDVCRIVDRYWAMHGLSTKREAIESFAKEIPASYGAVRHWMEGRRSIRAVVELRINEIAGRMARIL